MREYLPLVDDDGILVMAASACAGFSVPACCYTHAIGPRRSPRASRPFRYTGHTWCGRTTIGQRPRSEDSDNGQEQSGARVCVVWSVAEERASWYLVFWVVLDAVDVGKNCYESLCGL